MFTVSRLVTNYFIRPVKENERVRHGRNLISEYLLAKELTPEQIDRILREKYISKDTVEEKIEELKKEYIRVFYDYDEDGENIYFDEFKVVQIQAKIKGLQELLEKE